MSIKWKKKMFLGLGAFLLYEILLGIQSLTIPRQMLYNLLDISLITETLKISPWGEKVLPFSDLQQTTLKCGNFLSFSKYACFCTKMV